MSDFLDVPVTDLADDAVVLDIREQQEWDQGHAPGAIHIPMSQLPERVDELAPFLDSKDPLVITCRSGGRVQRVMPWLEQQGYDVANMAGGMRAWHAQGKPMAAGEGVDPSIT